jgi:hypothetical protein
MAKSSMVTTETTVRYTTNPNWDGCGVTFETPDGYYVIDPQFS